MKKSTFDINDIPKCTQIVLLNKNNEVLAVSRKNDHNDFGLIGGKIDPEDNSPEEAAIRETKEETGLDIHNLQLVYSKFWDGYYGYTYLAQYSGDIDFDEPHVVKWTCFQDIIDGSFGVWNQQVYESLVGMGVEIKL
jgi:8-oxo-dGTP pyrophosphatase MutT (NUDIX family)